MKKKLHHSQFCPEEMALLIMIETIKYKDEKWLEEKIKKQMHVSGMFLFISSQQGQDFWSEYYYKNRGKDHLNFI